jgi:hypothetical protein
VDRLLSKARRLYGTTSTPGLRAHRGESALERGTPVLWCRRCPAVSVGSAGHAQGRLVFLRSPEMLARAPPDSKALLGLEKRLGVGQVGPDVPGETLTTTASPSLPKNPPSSSVS